VVGCKWGGRVQTFDSPPASHKLLPFPFGLNLPARPLWITSKIFSRNSENKHIVSSRPLHIERSGFRPIVLNKVKKRDRAEARASFTLWPVSLEVVDSTFVIRLLSSLNAYSISSLIPKQHHTARIGLSHEFSGATVKANPPEGRDADFRLSGSYNFANIRLKRHKFPLYLYPHTPRLTRQLAGKSHQAYSSFGRSGSAAPDNYSMTPEICAEGWLEPEAESLFVQ